MIKTDKKGKLVESTKRPRRLEMRNVAGDGLQIHADIPYNPNCVEFVMKKGFQPIMLGGESRFQGVISYSPWIQFAPKDWNEMLETVFKEMVDLWNAKYATTDEVVKE